MFTDTKGKVLNQKDPDYFEFPLDNYEAQLAEIQQYAKDMFRKNNAKYLREINEKKSLIENQNILNHYLLLLKKQLFRTREQKVDTFTKNSIRETLFGSSPIIAKQIASYMVSFLIERNTYDEILIKELITFLDQKIVQEDK